jgi:hypothetical protein
MNTGLSDESPSLCRSVLRAVQVGIKVHISIGCPKALSQFIPRHQMSRAFQQNRKHLKRFLVELESDALPTKFPFHQVNLKLSELVSTYLRLRLQRPPRM